MGFVAHRACCLATAAIDAEVERHGLVLSHACHSNVRPILLAASGMFIKQARFAFIFSERARVRGALLLEPGFTESHSRQIVIAVIMDTPNRMRKVV